MYNIEVFTDGSSLIKDTYYEASSGVVIFVNSKEVCRIGDFHSNGTNSFGELYAIRIALDKVSEILPYLKDDQINISVTTDSEYVFKTFTSYVYKWVKSAKHNRSNEWYGSTGKKVKYQNIIKDIFETYIKDDKFPPIQFKHMRGHIGEKVSVNDALKKYIKTNGNISYDDFTVCITRNHIVDKLAEEARINKDNYKCILEESAYPWVRKISRNPKRNGAIVLKQRSHREN